MDSHKPSLLSVLRNGVIDENPTFRLVLGMCPTMAITTNVSNGIGMGLAATFVLVCSNMCIALLRSFIPAKVRIPAYIIVIATFTTIVDLMLKAFVPAVHAALGLYIPLIVVNCIIMARAESFASKNGVAASMADGLGMGIGFTCALILLSAIRELLGAGTLMGVQVLGSFYQPAAMLLQPPGGFICLALLLAGMNIVFAKISRKGDS